MVIKISDYIMESTISTADAPIDIINEQASAEIEVASKIANAYSKQLMMLEYYYQEDGESAAPEGFGAKVKEFAGKIIEAIKKAIEAVCDWFKKMFGKLKSLFKRDQIEQVKTTKDILTDIPAEKRDSLKVTITRADLRKYGDNGVGLSFDSIVSILNAAPKMVETVDGIFFPAVKTVEEAIREYSEKREVMTQQEEQKIDRRIQGAIERIRSIRDINERTGGMRVQGPNNREFGEKKKPAKDYGVNKGGEFQAPASEKDEIVLDYQQCMDVLDSAEKALMEKVDKKIEEVEDKLNELEKEIRAISVRESTNSDTTLWRNGRIDKDEVESRITALENEKKDATNSARIREINEELANLRGLTGERRGYQSARDRDRLYDSGFALGALSEFNNVLHSAFMALQSKFNSLYNSIKFITPAIRRAAEGIARAKKREAYDKWDRETEAKRRVEDATGATVGPDGNLRYDASSVNARSNGRVFGYNNR